MDWQIGCSGFYYQDWKNTFYSPELPQREWLQYYSQVFNTVEINATFYNFPKPAFLKGLYSKSSDAFSFSVKAPRLITHYKKFNDSKNLIEDFYGVVQNGLGSKLRCILFQLPANVVYSQEKLNQITENLHSSFQNVIEFRHLTWWNETVYNHLKKNKICFCSISHPSFPGKLIVNTSFIYYRMHGSVHLYKSKYKMSTLKKLAEEIKSSPKIKQAFIYFNNTSNAVGAENAKQLIELIK
jgi:uncharacterized protein YecE (DUF72 family)